MVDRSLAVLVYNLVEFGDVTSANELIYSKGLKSSKGWVKSSITFFFELKYLKGTVGICC